MPQRARPGRPDSRVLPGLGKAPEVGAMFYRFRPYGGRPEGCRHECERNGQLMDACVGRHPSQPTRRPHPRVPPFQEFAIRSSGQPLRPGHGPVLPVPAASKARQRTVKEEPIARDTEHHGAEHRGARLFDEFQCIRRAQGELNASGCALCQARPTEEDDGAEVARGASRLHQHQPAIDTRNAPLRSHRAIHACRGAQAAAKRVPSAAITR
jgi:hypothetical protein